VLSAPEPLTAGGKTSASNERAVTDEAVTGETAAPSAEPTTTTMSHRGAPNHDDVTSSWSRAGAEEGGRAADEAEEVDEAGGSEERGVDRGCGERVVEEGCGDGEDRREDEEQGVDGDWGEDEDRGEDGELVAVRAPLPGTFYRAPRPGAAPFVEVGSLVGADTVIGIVETMKLMNSVPAGVAGMVAEFCVANAEFAAQGAALLRIRADR
jgi:biotin carboxyl carrier protein